MMKDEYAEAITLHLEHIAAILSDIAKALESPVISPAINYSAPPEISPEIDDGEDLVLVTDDDILKAVVAKDLDPTIIDIEDDKYYERIRLNKFLADKNKWNAYNQLFKSAGFKWVSAGKDSRWERKKEAD